MARCPSTRRQLAAWSNMSTDAPIAKLIATLGEQKKAQRVKIAEHVDVISSLRLELKSAEGQLEEAQVLRNSRMLDFMKFHAQEQERKHKADAMREANLRTWGEIESLQAQLVLAQSQLAQQERTEAEAEARRRNHATAVSVVQQRVGLPEALLRAECAELSAELSSVDQRETECRAGRAARVAQERQTRILELLASDRAVFAALRTVGGTDAELQSDLDALQEGGLVYQDSYGQFLLL